MGSFELLWNEYMTAGQQLRDICGAETMESLIRILEITVRRLHIVRGFIFTYDSEGRRHFRNAPSSLPFLLHTCAWSNVTDPKDKIYGTLGLHSDSFLLPGYGISVENVYIRSAFTIMKHMGNLILLSQAGPRQQSRYSLPTWVPDWTQQTVSTASYIVFHPFYRAGPGNVFDFGLVEESKLALRANFIDEVTLLSEVFDTNDCTTSMDLRKTIRRVLWAWKAMYMEHEMVSKPPGAKYQVVNTRDPLFQRTIQKVNKAPLLRDADHRRSRVFPIQNSGNLPLQSVRAPFFRDKDYALPRPLLQSPQNFRKSEYFPQQSFDAPFIRDADYQVPRQVPELEALSPKLSHNLSRNLSSVLTQINQLQPNPNLATPQTQHTSHAGPYRAYNGFSHTYVTQGFQGEPDCNILPTFDTAESQSPPNDFWRLMCLDVIDCPLTQSYRRCVDGDYIRFQAWLAWIIDLSASSTMIPQLHWHLNTVLQGKRMFRTANGHIGVASRNVNKGDKVFVLTGEAYPYILRSVDESPSPEYKLVSPAFVHGVMDGEVKNIPRWTDVHIV